MERGGGQRWDRNKKDNGVQMECKWSANGVGEVYIRGVKSC